MSDVSTSTPITCVGHGLCAELFPDLIELDDWGLPDSARAVPHTYANT